MTNRFKELLNTMTADKTMRLEKDLFVVIGYTVDKNNIEVEFDETLAPFYYSSNRNVAINENGDVSIEADVDYFNRIETMLQSAADEQWADWHMLQLVGVNQQFDAPNVYNNDYFNKD